MTVKKVSYTLGDFPRFINELRSNTAKAFLIAQTQIDNWSQKCGSLSKFLEQLAKFILNEKNKDSHQSASHICLATLNYDNLISRYYHLSQKHNIIGGGREGVLQDGFGNGKSAGNEFPTFKAENLTASDREHMGYYLHLHGSAIFDVIDNSIIKRHANREDFTIDQVSLDTEKNIVLANKEEKLDLIGSSELLREYWKVFEKNIYHCKHLFLVGCGVNDDHIKKQIMKRLKYFKDKPLNIFVISRFYEDSELEDWKKFIDETLPPSMETKVITHNEINYSVLDENGARVLIKMEESLLDFHWFQEA